MHRWLGAIAAIQLLLWTASGLYFTLSPIEEIRGSHLTDAPGTFFLRHSKMVSPSELAAKHEALASTTLDDISIAQRLHTPVYLVKVAESLRVYDAATGNQLPPIDESTARAIAAQHTSVAIKQARLIEQTDAGHEYRGGELPAWRITLAGDDEAQLYLGANSGQLRAVRTNNWRLFDLLWSLHIMDYSQREQFDHWLIRVMAALGLATILSGAVLFLTTLRLRRFTSQQVPVD